MKRIFLVPALIFITSQLSAQKVDTIKGQSPKSVLHLNDHQDYYKANKIRKETVKAYWIDNKGAYNTKSVRCTREFDKDGLLVTMRDLTVSQSSYSIPLTTFEYDANKKVVRIVETYPTKNIKVYVVNYNSTLSEINVINVMNPNDTVRDSKRRITLITARDYANGGKKEVYEYDDAGKLKKITERVRFFYDVTSQWLEFNSKVRTYEYKDGKTYETEEWFEDKRYEHRGRDKRGMAQKIYTKEGVKLEYIEFNPDTKKPERSEKAEYEYF